MFHKEICCVVLFCALFDGSAFKLFDAETLMSGSTRPNVTDAELQELLDIDPGGEYTTMKFQYERDQFMGQYDNPDDRCYNDHVRCLTSIMTATRPVCGIDVAGTKSEFNSVCDLYLDNCKRTEPHWTVMDSGHCKDAHRIYSYKIT